MPVAPSVSRSAIQSDTFSLGLKHPKAVSLLSSDAPQGSGLKPRNPTIAHLKQPHCPNICPNIFYYIRALVRCYQYTDRSATIIEVCNRSAHCEGINGRQPHNLSTLILLAEPTRYAHGRARAAGSVRHKGIRCNSDIDQLEKHLTAPQNSRPPWTCQ
jgi:hypothetical protein